MTSTRPIDRTILDVVTDLRGLCIPTQRELGDLARNVVLWLVGGSEARQSSFGFPELPPSIDKSRLTEAPYLAALGYLYGSGILAAPVPQVICSGLKSVLRRSPHTVEKSGFVDDPLQGLGFLLLAEAAADGESAQRLRELFRQVESIPSLAALVLAKVDRTQIRRTLLNESCLKDLSLPILADDEIALRVFPGLTQKDAKKKLVERVCLGDLSPAADMDTMLVLAALEVAVPQLAFPVEDTTIVEPLVDVAIVIALKEEFRELFEVVKSRCTHVEEGGRHYYHFNTSGPIAEGQYRCMATLVGDMGPSKAGIVTEKTIERWRPATAVMIGIAAGIHEDVRVGDVVVASQVDNYLDSAKAVGDGRFELAGDGYQADHALLDRVRNFEFVNHKIAAQWKDEAGSRLTNSGIDVAALIDQDLIREQPDQIEAHVASGPIVAASTEFVAWVKKRDRAYKALEMESGGLAVSAHMNTHGTVALVIRAISDYGDKRKKVLDEVGRGALRQYAMQNATEFLWALLKGGVLSRKG